MQHTAGINLVKSISFYGNESVLDVGCGDGKITAEISKLIPRGHITGMDISLKMIDFAKKTFHPMCYPNLTFETGNAESIPFVKQFDLVFSSFALQWVLNIHGYLDGARHALKDNGRLAITVPLEVSENFEYALKKIMSAPKWSIFFEDFISPWNFTDQKKYENLLIENRFNIDCLKKEIQIQRFKSRTDLENYILPWLPHLQYIPPELQHHFFSQVIDKFLRIETCPQLRFNRLDVLCSVAPK